MSGAIDIVYLACYEKWWDWERSGFVSRSAIVAQGLARRAEVRRMLVVDPAGSVGRELARGRLYRSRISPRDGVHVHDHVRLLPRETKWPAAYRLNAPLHDRAFVRSLRGAMADLGMERAVIWMAGPLVAKYAEEFAANPVVYDAVDEWTADPAQLALRNEILRSYDLIRTRADLVFAVSPALARTFSGSRPAVRVVPNGIHTERFEGAHPLPDDLAAIPGTRVGYVGVLQNRLDVELIAETARRMPELSFVFVGPVLDRAHFAPLRPLANVHFLGPRPASVVPDYVCGFDVCMLPHVRSALTANMDPLKLYEYLAGRKPVVTTDLPLSQPPGLVRVATDAESFGRALAESADGRWEPDAPALDRYLAEVSWDARLDAMIDALRDVLPSAEDARQDRRLPQSGGSHV